MEAQTQLITEQENSTIIEDDMTFSTGNIIADMLVYPWFAPCVFAYEFGNTRATLTID